MKKEIIKEKKLIGLYPLLPLMKRNEDETEEERKEAALKAQTDTTRKNIVSLLSEKFDFVPRNIRESIIIIDDLDVLDELHKKIIKVDTIEEFKKLLDKAKKMS